MKRFLIVLIIAITSCQSTSSDNDKTDSLGIKPGQTEEQRIAEIKDSLSRRIQEAMANDSAILAANAPVKVTSAKPVEKEYSNYKDIHLVWKNVSKKTISAIRFKWTGINAFGEPAEVGAISGSIGGGFSDERLKPGKSQSGTWEITSRDLKKVTKAWAYEVVFEDGSKWQIEN